METFSILTVTCRQVQLGPLIKCSCTAIMFISIIYDSDLSVIKSAAIVASKASLKTDFTYSCELKVHHTAARQSVGKNILRSVKSHSESNFSR